jgi:anti-sigma factor RsiW
MSPGDQTHPCFTDFALQEFVQGRLDSDVRQAVEKHLEACQECRRAAELLQSESALLRDALMSATPVEAGEPPDIAVLAAYLDGALDDAAVREFEARLASDPRLLHALARLQAEVSAVVANQGERVRQSAAQVPAGQILRMPKRAAPPPVVTSGELKYGGGQAG